MGNFAPSRMGPVPRFDDFCFRINNTECTESEAAEKAGIRKIIKETCIQFIKCVERKELIGAGGFGEVYTCKLKGYDPLLIQKICRRITSFRSTHMEMYCLTSLNNEYIPKLVYSGYTEDGKWCTILQYYDGGTLDHHIDEEIKRKAAKTELKISCDQKKYIAYHLGLAIEYIHSKLFIHG